MATWLIFVITVVFINKKTRNSAFDVIKAACKKQLITPFLIMIVYAFLLTSLFSMTKFWEWKYLKDIFIWVLFVGIPVCFGAVNKGLKKNYFKSMVIDNLKFIVLIEFLFSTFTFNIYVELIMIPCITFVYLLEVVASTDEKLRTTGKIFSGFLAIIGFTVLGFTLNIAINDYKSLGVIETLVVFFIPFVLSILYVPVAYFVALYAKYEIIFIRVMLNKKWTNEQIRKKKCEIYKACSWSYKKLLLFEKEYVNRIYAGISDNEYCALIQNFKKQAKLNV
jgi:hypothetical protein